MQYKKILVPYDGSDHAKKALEAACDLLRDNKESQMRVVTVVPAPAITPKPGIGHMHSDSRPPVALMDMDDYAEVIGQAIEDECNHVKEQIAGILEEFGSRVQADAVPNLSPVDGITEYVKANDVDLIVMGRRGLGALRGMLGSVSYGILRSAEIPVLTVK